MSELLLISVFAVVLAALVYFFSAKSEKQNNLKQNKKNSQRPFQQHSKEYTLNSKHAAVTISHEPDACEAVKEFGNTRFLVREAPVVPLKGCTQSTSCSCHYLHHTDRRKSARQHETTEANERKAKLRDSNV